MPGIPSQYFDRKVIGDDGTIAVLGMGEKDTKLDSVVKEIKEELKLHTLGWQTSCGRISIYCHVVDVPKIYEIINYFLRQGYLLFLNDGTMTPLKPGQVITPESLQISLLEKLRSFRHNLGIPPSQVFSFSFDEEDFWIIEEGKKFARAEQTFASLDLVAKNG
jgi:hypothetical protein